MANGAAERRETQDKLDVGRQRQWFDRLIQLSDGVFAIAITLLAFDLHGPRVWDGGLASLWADLAPKLDAYALSFVVISVYWLAHRRFMALVHTVDAPVSILTLGMLALVALLPAATQLAHSHGTLQATMLVYGLLVVAIGLLLAAVWAYAALIANLVSPEVTSSVRWFLLLLMVFTPPLFLGLIMALRTHIAGATPLALFILFLIGWRMRMRTLRRLAKVRSASPAADAQT
ncbi:MAG TPA: TMEM175 family protein [Caulobacteraceae bacterium]